MAFAPVPTPSTQSLARRALLDALTQVVADVATAQRLLDRTLQHSGHPAVPRSRRALLDFVRDHVVTEVGATVGPVRCSAFVRSLVAMVKQLPQTRRAPRTQRSARAAPGRPARVLIHHGDRLVAAAFAKALVRARLEPVVTAATGDVGGVRAAIVDLEASGADDWLRALAQREPPVVVLALATRLDDAVAQRLSALGIRNFDVLPRRIAPHVVQVLACQRLC